MNTKLLLSILCLLTMLLSACMVEQIPQPLATQPGTDTPAAAIPSQPAPTQELPKNLEQLTPGPPVEKEPPEMTPISIDDLPASLQAVARKAIALLSDQLSLDPGEIQLLSAAAVTWSDSSLGCPRPGMAYLQVLTDGYRVVLSANGQAYDYHANKNGDGSICKNPAPPYSEGSELQ